MNLNSSELMAICSVIIIAYFIYRSSNHSDSETVRPKNKPKKDQPLSVGDIVTVTGYSKYSVKNNKDLPPAPLFIFYRKPEDSLGYYEIMYTLCSIYAVPVFIEDKYIVKGPDGTLLCVENRCLFKE